MSLRIDKSILELATWISSYGTQLTEFLEGFPEAQILVLEFSELVENQNRLMQKIEKFLGLPCTHIGKEQQIHSNESQNRFSLDDANLRQLHDLLYEDMLAFLRLANFDITRWGFGV